MRVYLGIALGMLGFLAVLIALGEAMQTKAPLQYGIESQRDVITGEPLYDATMPEEMQAQIETEIQQRIQAAVVENATSMSEPTVSADLLTKIATLKNDPTSQALRATALAEPDVQDVMMIYVVSATPTIGF